MRYIKRLFKEINTVFIRILLLLFYLFGIGFGFILRLVFIQKQKNKSYWQEAKNDKISLNSPY